jgi:hypothetical protein
MLYQKITKRIAAEGIKYLEKGDFDLNDLIYAQKLSYGQRMELLEQINEFLVKTMPCQSKRISLKLREMNF